MNWFKSKSCRIWLCFYGSAAVTALTLVFPQMGFLEWISLIPMIAVVFSQFDGDALTSKQSYWRGFWGIYLYYAVIYHWFIALYPLDFVGLNRGASLVVVLAGWLGLSLLQALPGGLVFLAFRRICKTETIRKYSILKPFVFAGLWVVFEWLSTLSWMGVPWGRLYMGQVEYLPMIQSAAWFGSYFISFLLLTVNGVLAYALCYRAKQTACIALSAGLIVGNLTFGLIRMKQPDAADSTVRVAVIQGNISSHDKWELSTTYRMMQRYRDLTAQAAEAGAELIVWPETAVTVALNRSKTMKTYVSDLARTHQVMLLVGALHEDETGEHNSLYVVSPDGEISEQRYDKRHLVPFGEYVPMRGLVETVIPPLAELSALDIELSAGKDSALLDTPWGRVGAMICFDSIYEMLGIDSVRDGAGLMILSTNDSWFLDSKAVYQHQAQAQFRAIEEGRYLARSANTGISTILSPRGEILCLLDPLTEGYAVSDVAFLNQRTPYSVIGNALVYLCGAFCLAIPLADKLRRRRPERAKSEHACDKAENPDLK